MYEIPGEVESKRYELMNDPRKLLSTNIQVIPKATFLSSKDTTNHKSIQDLESIAYGSSNEELNNKDIEDCINDKKEVEAVCDLKQLDELDSSQIIAKNIEFNKRHAVIESSDERYDARSISEAMNKVETLKDFVDKYIHGEQLDTITSRERSNNTQVKKPEESKKQVDKIRSFIQSIKVDSKKKSHRSYHDKKLVKDISSFSSCSEISDFKVRVPGIERLNQDVAKENTVELSRNSPMERKLKIRATLEQIGTGKILRFIQKFETEYKNEQIQVILNIKS